MMKALHIFGAAVLCSALYAGAVQAQPYGFTDYQRALIGDWVVDSLGGCPNGSRAVTTGRKKDDSLRCLMASGSGIVLYAPGETIPETVPSVAVPADIGSQLPEPKMGEVYIIVDNNLYLVTPETRIVVTSIIVMKPE